MRTLVLGGIRSGKSRWAEEAMSAAVGQERVRYIATGHSGDSDASWTARIADHRDRRPATWTTVESGDVAAQLRGDQVSPALVDDLGGWLTRALDGRRWGASPTDEVDDLLDAVADFGGPLMVVSPEVGLTVVPATEAGRQFADELGALNQKMAQVCERVVLVVAGLPVWVKNASDAEQR